MSGRGCKGPWKSLRGREGSEGPSGNPGGVRRAPWKIGRGREGPRKSGRIWEGPPDVREGSGGPLEVLEGSGGVGRALRKSGRGQEGPRMSGKGWVGPRKSLRGWERPWKSLRDWAASEGHSRSPVGVGRGQEDPETLGGIGRFPRKSGSHRVVTPEIREGSRGPPEVCKGSCGSPGSH